MRAELMSIVSEPKTDSATKGMAAEILVLEDPAGSLPPVLAALANEKREFKTFMISRLRGLATTHPKVKAALG